MSRHNARERDFERGRVRKTTGKLPAHRRICCNCESASSKETDGETVWTCANTYDEVDPYGKCSDFYSIEEDCE